MQLEISYSGIDGSKHLRVLTHLSPICYEKEKCEAVVDEEILRVNAVQQAAKIARNGDVEKARAYAVGWGNKFKNLR